MDSTTTKPHAGRTIYAAITTVASGTLMLQILITRIFSVTMFYHYAFAVIALTMLGLTVGALWIYLRREKTLRFATPEENLAYYASGMAALTLAGTLLHTQIHFANGSLALLLSMLIFIPAFIFGGVVIALILTHYSAQISRLYAADLIGAALGCLLTIWMLEWLGVFNAVFLVCMAIALVGVALLRSIGNASRLVKPVTAIAFAIGLLTVGNLTAQATGLPHISLRWVKNDTIVESVEFESWNSYSRVAIQDNGIQPPFGWGLSTRYQDSYPQLAQKRIDIDANAATFMTKFSGLSELDFLKHDIINTAYHIRPVQSVTVIGVGGGRDVLSAHVHGATRILGVEMNKAILGAITGDYADFSGHVAKIPGVTLVNDEARSYLVRQDNNFDLIQVSLIDTWAATAAGAYALTENTLYTQDAWQNFFHLLNPQGMLTFSRWYRPGEHEWETLRTVKLGAEMLEAEGIRDIRDHIIVTHNNTVASVVIGKDPFTPEDMKRLQAWTDELGFKILLSPTQHDAGFTPDFKTTADLDAFLVSKNFSTVTPSDNQPYFFNILNFDQLVKGMLSTPETADDFNVTATHTLLKLLAMFTVLSLLFIIAPLLQSLKENPIKGTAPHLVYFACLGLGFMFIEISQLQRMMIFLGHPTYALSVVLSTLLLFSGLGSFSTAKLLPVDAWQRLVLLCLVVVAFSFGTHQAYNIFRESATGVRLFIAFLAMAPLGFVLGMAFPLGIKLAESQGHHKLLPWFWGINGVTSVLASILALVVAMFAGLHVAFTIGLFCYVIAATLYWLQVRVWGAHV